MNPETQKARILEYLKGGHWQCFASDKFFIKDDRKRISELNQSGYRIIGTPCDGRCGINHHSRVFMRRLVGKPNGKTKNNTTK